MNKALSIELVLTLPEAADVAPGQRWVLSAMSKHGQLLVQVLWRILGNESDVCDAYQETFLKLAGNNSAAPENDKIKTYLLRTGTNSAIDILRNRRNRLKLQNNLAREHCESYTYDVSDLDTHRLVDELRTKLTRLPENLQQVIMLRDLGEMPYDQVAEVVGVTIETARVYRRRAIVMLSEMMDESNKQ